MLGGFQQNKKLYICNSGKLTKCIIPTDKWSFGFQQFDSMACLAVSKSVSKYRISWVQIHIKLNSHGNGEEDNLFP